MDTFTHRDLQLLATHRGSWCISLLFPTDRTAGGMLQNPLRLKKLMAQTERLLVERGRRAPDARRAVEPLEELLHRNEFWNGVSEGVAIFVDQLEMQAYRLPLSFSEDAVVGQRFYIKPLLPLSVGEGTFFVLAVSGNAVQFYRGDRWSMHEVDVPDLPKNRAASLNYDQPEEVRQVHTATAGGRFGTQMGFHGQGGRVDAAKKELQEFLQIVNHRLEKYLANEKAPLLFAGVEYLFPIFKATCSYPNLSQEHLRANTETWTSGQLHEAAWAIVAPRFMSERDEAVARCRQAAGTDYALLQLERVLQACHQGQVETLLVDPRQSFWGQCHSESRTVHLDGQPRPGNEELLNLAAALTIENRGRVFPAESSALPDRSPIAALLRYPSTATPIPHVQAAAH